MAYPKSEGVRHGSKVCHDFSVHFPFGGAFIRPFSGVRHGSRGPPPLSGGVCYFSAVC